MHPGAPASATMSLANTTSSANGANTSDETHPLPARPRLRAVEPVWVHHENEPRLWLRDPLELTDRTALVPAALVPLLAAMDGTRDLPGLRRAYAEETGFFLTDHVLEGV